MQTTSTPLTAFHAAIRAILDDEDQEVHTAYKITEKTKLVLSVGKVPGYKTSADSSSVEPALTPDQKALNLLVYETVLLFPTIGKDLRTKLEWDVHELKNGLFGMS